MTWEHRAGGGPEGRLALAFQGCQAEWPLAPVLRSRARVLVRRLRCGTLDIPFPGHRGATAAFRGLGFPVWRRGSHGRSAGGLVARRTARALLGSRAALAFR